MSTARRCIVNVATGPYLGLQERLALSLRRTGYRDGLLLWRNAYPAGSPRHEDAPYAFKLFAIRDAERRGFTSVLWLDAPCVAERPVAPLFDRIEREGYLFVAGDDRLGNWSSDECLSAFSVSRTEAMGLDLMNGTFIGLDLRNPVARRWLEGLERACHAGLFAGPYLSHHAPERVRRAKRGKPRGFVSADRRCWGHRHDEAVGTCLARRLGLDLAQPDGFFRVESRGGVIAYHPGP